MVDNVKTNVIFQGGRKVLVHLECISDGTGETKVVKVDLGNLSLFNGKRPTSLALIEASFNVDGFTNVVMYWQRDPSDIEMLVLKGRGAVAFPGGLQDPNRDGTGTGNILLSSTGPVSGNTYQIDLEFRLKD